MDPFTIIAGLIAAGASIIGSTYNAQSTRDTNETNLGINERNLEYQQKMTERQWERDDTSYQRQVADLQAAGLSPLLINGGTQNSQPLSAPTPIPASAPQFDTSSLINAIQGSSQLMENKRHNKAEEDLRSAEIDNTSEQIKLKARELDIKDKDVESEIKYRANLISLESKRIKETERANKRTEDIKEKEYNLNKLSYESKKYFEEIKHQAGGEDVPYKVYNDFNSYLTAREIYLEAYNNFIDELKSTRLSQASSMSMNGGLNIMGNGGSAGGSSSDYISHDESQRNQAMWKKFQQKYPVPVFISK